MRSVESDLIAGQRVRVANPGGWMHGLTATVVSITGDAAYVKFRGGITGGFPIEQLETVEPKKPKSGKRQTRLVFTD